MLAGVLTPFVTVPFVIVSAVSANAPSPTTTNPFRIGRPLVIPHAGGDGQYPENTILALARSMAAGGDVVDIDVSMTADNVLIAFHDPTLERTTNGTGSVSSKTYPQISKLDAGWKFKRNGKYPYRNKNVRIPTVAMVLNRFPAELVTLDLKDLTVRSATEVCVLLTKLNRSNNVYVGVDTTEQVMEFRAKCPKVRTSGTDEERRVARAARESGDTTFVSKQLVSQPSYIANDGTKRVTAETLAFAHRNNTAVLTWVVDDRESLSDLIDLGVDGIYTRKPDLMLKILREKGKR
jgi:glycerophosphoryl diester phosphodiesterase